MKKSFIKAAAVLVTLAASLFTTSCSKKETKDLLTQIKEKGEITIAMEGAWAPWTYHDADNSLTGFDVEVGRAVAQKLGVKAKFVEVDWDGIFAGIDSGRYDISLNGVEITDERSYKYSFSVPYAYTKTALIVRNDNKIITSFEDLKGKTSTNSLGSTYAELAESYGAHVITIDSFDETLELVEHGRADATLNDSATFYYYQKVQPDNDFKIACLSSEASKIAIPMRKAPDTASLKTAIDKAVEELLLDGTIAEISVKFFGEDMTK